MSGKFMNSNKILIIILLLIFSNNLLALTTVTKNANGDWQLFLDGKPFFVKGVNYDTTKVCSMQDWKYLDSNNNGVLDGPYEAWVDENKNNNRESSEVTVGDFKLMQNMGANVIRHYLDGRSSDYANWKNLFRDLYYNYGIMVIMGNFLGAYGVGVGETPVDYTNPTHRARMLQSVTNVVLAYKDEPYILFWILGNENNYTFTSTLAYQQPAQYAQFLNLVAQKIKQLDPTRPVAMCNGDTQFLSYYNQYAQSIDIFGLNCFRGSDGFRLLFSEVKSKFDRPVLLTEYGGPWESAWENGEIKPTFEEDQYIWHKNCWQDIINNKAGSGYGNAIGGIVVHWLDRWWEHGDWCTQDPGDNGGICSQGDGSKSPFLRQLRLVYYYYQQVWGGKENQIEPEAQSYQIFASIPKNYPNPFSVKNGENTRIEFSLKQLAKIGIKIYDINRNLIRNIPEENTYFTYLKYWDGKDENKNPVSKGVYFAIIKAVSLENQNIEEQYILKIMVK